MRITIQLFIKQLCQMKKRPRTYKKGTPCKVLVASTNPARIYQSLNVKQC